MRDEAGLVRESACERAGLVSTEVGQRRAGWSGVEPTLDVAVRLSVPDQHQPSTHDLPPGLPPAAASSSGGGVAPPPPRRPRAEITHVGTPFDQCSECLGNGVIVDVADEVEEKDVCAEFGSGGPGLDPGQVDVPNRELPHRRRPAPLGRCPGAAPPMSGRRPFASAAGRPGPTSTNRVRALGSSTMSGGQCLQAVPLCGERGAHRRVRPAGGDVHCAEAAFEFAGTDLGFRQI